MFNPADTPDPDDVYANYLRTCAMLGIDHHLTKILTQFTSVPARHSLESSLIIVLAIHLDRAHDCC